MPLPPAVSTTHVGFTYPAPPTEALRDVTFAVPRGSFCAIIGPNGSGKTTLIKLLMGLLTPTAGEVRVMGLLPSREPRLVQRLIGYVPQRNTVNTAVPLMVREVVGLPACARLGLRSHRCRIRGRVSAALEMVGMGGSERRPFQSLSGGQQQRVLIARALALDPHILILDEPFSRVDAASQHMITDLLHRLSREHQVTVIAVVHNVNPLVHFVDHVLLLRTEVVAFGDPATVLTADNLQLAYGVTVPILVCEEGYRHPVLHTSHE